MSLLGYLAERERIERGFWQRVDKGETCWLWTGHINRSHGYGQLCIHHPSSRYGLRRKAHRISWELHNGPIPGDLCVLHRCDVRACVNPAHLFLGTRADNNADKEAKGRARHGRFHGVRNPSARLTESNVIAIRELLRQRTLSQREIGLRFGVSRTTIEGIATGRRWGSLDAMATEDAT